MNPSPEKHDPEHDPEASPAVPEGYRPTWAERREELRPYVGPAIAVLVLVLMGGVAGWSYYRNLTRGSDTPAVRPPASPPATGATVGDEGRLAVLDRLIASQTELMRAQRSVDPEQKARLGSLEEERAALRGKLYGERSRRAETEATLAAGEGRTAAAMEKWEEALRWQREANANRSPPDAAETAREGRLATTVDDLKAAGLKQILESERARAERAERAEDWAEAEQAYLAWRNAQAAINEKLPASRLADPKVLDRLDTAIASMQAAALATAVTRAERAAATAEQAGATTTAAAAIAQALDAQRRINSDLPTSRYASAERAAELEVRWQSLASAEGLGRIEQLAAEGADLLRRGETASALARVGQALAALEENAAKYPKSQRRAPSLRRRLVFLDLRREEVAALQQSLLAGLVPVPGRPGVQMLATEVPQRLFERLMNYNPSLQAGPLLPVECVSWADAVAFCERAGWVLGRTVRLPREAEYRAALPQDGPGARLAAPGRSVSPRPVPAATAAAGGFSDLVGNVAEWLESGSPYTAELAGGSYRTPVSAGGVTMVTENKGLRAPQNGFRYVVE